MFEFTPIEPKGHRVNLYLNKGYNHVIVCWGNPVALLSVVDYLGTEQNCGTHAVSRFPTEAVFNSMVANVHAGVGANEHRQGGNTILWITDDNALLPYYAKAGADLVLFGEKDGSITCHKDRSDQIPATAKFRCTGSSSPTGRLPMPSSPAMHNMRPSDGRLIDASNDRIGPRVPRHFDVKDTSWRGYSMGASVKEPECPMCEAGLPKYKQGEKPTTLLFKSYNDHAIMTHTSDGEMKLNDGKGREFIKVNAEGEAFVRGEKVAAGQQDIYEMFRAWMQKMAGGGVPLPKPGVIDAQGNVFTKECIDDLRKQVESHGLPVRMFNTGPYEGPIWDSIARNPCNEVGMDGLRIDGDGSKNILPVDDKRIITKTGHDITAAVRRQETASLINDVDSDPHITDSLRERIIAALKVR